MAGLRQKAQKGPKPTRSEKYLSHGAFRMQLIDKMAKAAPSLGGTFHKRHIPKYQPKKAKKKQTVISEYNRKYFG